jgi:hypothetical protein
MDAECKGMQSPSFPELFLLIFQLDRRRLKYYYPHTLTEKWIGFTSKPEEREVN